MLSAHKLAVRAAAGARPRHPRPCVRHYTHRARKVVMPRCRACSPQGPTVLIKNAGACALLSACQLPLWVFLYVCS